MSRFTADDIKRETMRAFRPLRCEIHDFDYDSGFEFSVFRAQDPELVYMGKLRTSQYQDPESLAQLFRQWRTVVAAKGHKLNFWTAPLAAAHEDVHHEAFGHVKHTVDVLNTEGAAAQAAPITPDLK
jgi:hypothetical protein